MPFPPRVVAPAPAAEAKGTAAAVEAAGSRDRPGALCRALAARPRACAALATALALSVAAVAFAWWPLSLDTGLKSFSIIEGEEVEAYDAAFAAEEAVLEKWELAEAAAAEANPDSSPALAQRRLLEDGGDALVPRPYTAWKVDLFYTIRGPPEVALAQVRRLEAELARTPGIERFCVTDRWTPRCLPPDSLMSLLPPEPFNITRADAERLAERVTRGGLYWYVDDTFRVGSDDASAAGLIDGAAFRSQLRFGMPVSGYASSSDRPAEQEAEYAAFARSLLGPLSRASTPALRVNFGGEFITAHEIQLELVHDATLVAGAVLSVFVYMVLYMRSIVLAAVGMLQILLSFPIAFVVFASLLSATHGVDPSNISALQLVSLFLVVGIGVDDVFVFMTAFRRGDAGRRSGELGLAEQLAGAYMHAGKATLMTSCSTAAAFAASALSAIPAVRAFGALTAAMVMTNWVLVMTLFPAYVATWDVHLRRESWSESKDDSPRVSVAPSSVSAIAKGGGWAGAGAGRWSEYIAAVGRVRWTLIVALLGGSAAAGGLLATRITLSDAVPALFRADHNVQLYLEASESRFLTPKSCFSDCALGLAMDIDRNNAGVRPGGSGPSAEVVPTTVNLYRSPPPPPMPSQALPSAPQNDLPASSLPSPPPGRDSPISTPSIATVPPPGHSPAASATSPQPPPGPASAAAQASPPPSPPLPPVPPPSPPWPAPPPAPRPPPTPPPPEYQEAPKPRSGALEDIVLLWGISGLDRSAAVAMDPFVEIRGTPTYDLAFDMAAPSAQSFLLSFCEAFAANHTSLTHSVRRCLPNALHDWAERHDPSLGWPIPRERFYETLEDFLNARPVFRLDVGYAPGMQRATWLRVVHKASFPSYSPPYEVRAEHRLWLRAVDEWARVQAAALSISGAGDGDLQSVSGEAQALLAIRVTSEAAVWSVTQIAAIEGTSAALTVSLLSAFVFVVIFTGCSLRLAGLVLLELASILCMILSVFHLSGWELGVVEAVALTTLVGLAVDFGLHLAEAYAMCGHEDLEDAIDSGCALVDSSDISSTSARAKRLLRAQVSAAAIAPAIVAAAGSTVAALVPMCFCKLVLLKRFALIIIIALALSAFLGLHLLVPLFMCSAPADLPRPTLRRVGQALFGSGGRALATVAVLGAVVGALATVRVRDLLAGAS